MENYEVILYPTSKQDLLDIIDYLNTLSPDAALRYYDLLTEEIASPKGYRYLIVKDYLVFYVVSGQTVQIRRILYGRRDYQALL